MKVGRNAPCPCGSGKKYKKCCLANDEAQAREQAAMASGPPRRLAGEPLAPSSLPPRPPTPLADWPAPPPPPPRTPEDEAADARWEAFDAAEGFDERFRVYRQFFDEDVMEPDEAADLLLDLDGLAKEPAQQDRLRALVEAIKQQAPRLYEDEAALYDAWLIRDAVRRGQFDQIPALLESILSAPDQHIDDLYDALYQLLYHDQAALALAALRRAWPAIRDSSARTQWGIDEAKELLTTLTFAQLVADQAEPDPAQLEAAVASIEGVDADLLRRLARRLLGGADLPFRPGDFGAHGKERWLRLAELTMAWLGLLLRQGVPPGRAVLARLGLLEYFRQRLDDQAAGAALLLPRADLLPEFLRRALGLLSHYRVYLVASMLEYLPTYADLLAQLDLATPNALAKLLPELHEAQHAAADIFRDDWQETGAFAALAAAIGEAHAG